MSGCLPVALQQVRQLADRGRLAGAVDADDQRDLRRRGHRRPADRRRRRPRGSRASPDRAGFRRRATRVLTASMIRSVAATPMSAEISSSSSASIVSTSTGRLAPFGLVGATDDLVEAVDDLLFGAGETLANAAEDTHRGSDSSMTLVIRLRPLRPQHQRFEPRCGRPCARRAPPPSASQSAARRRGARRAPAPRRSCDAFGDHLHAGEDLGELAARAPARSRRAGCGSAIPVHVSTRSPRPLRPDGVSRRAARGARQPRDLRQPARDQRRQRVVAEPQPFDDAGRDRDDVLQRAADFDADDVVDPYSRKYAPRNSACTRSMRGVVVRGHEHGGRQLLRHLEREARTRQHDDRMTGRRPPARSPPTSAASCRASSPLVALTMIAPCDERAARQRESRRGTHATEPRRRPARCRRARRASDSVGHDARRAARMSGRYTAFARRCAMSRTVAGSRAHSRTSWPTRARCTASAVPQLPAPSTATRHIMLALQHGARSHLEPAPDCSDAGRRSAPPTRTPRTTAARRTCRIRDRRQHERGDHRTERDVACGPDGGRERDNCRRQCQRHQHAEHTARGRHALCRRGNAATPGRCDRPPPRSRQAPPAYGASARRPATRTPAAPLATSRMATTTPARTPDARNTLAAPMFPLPMRCRSRTPRLRLRAAAQRVSTRSGRRRIRREPASCSQCSAGMRTGQPAACRCRDADGAASGARTSGMWSAPADCRRLSNSVTAETDRRPRCR